MAIRLERRGCYWAVYEDETLICLTVYKKGAKVVVSRLTTANAWKPHERKAKEATPCRA
jgi:hypothetical protein